MRKLRKSVQDRQYVQSKRSFLFQHVGSYPPNKPVLQSVKFRLEEVQKKLIILRSTSTHCIIHKDEQRSSYLFLFSPELLASCFERSHVVADGGCLRLVAITHPSAHFLGADLVDFCVPTGFFLSPVSLALFSHGTAMAQFNHVPNVLGDAYLSASLLLHHSMNATSTFVVAFWTLLCQERRERSPSQCCRSRQVNTLTHGLLTFQEQIVRARDIGVE